MFKDPQFMVTLQIGLIGIVLVAGFYLIWKALTRIEEKVDLMLLDKQSQQFFQTHSSEQTAESAIPSTDAMMKAIFSEDMEGEGFLQGKMDSGEGFLQGKMDSAEGGFMIFSTPFQMPPEVIEDSEKVTIEEMKPDITAESDITITNIGYSKTKLKTMNVDKLKELCQERHLSTEGTKNQLIQRLLE